MGKKIVISHYAAAIEEVATLAPLGYLAQLLLLCVVHLFILLIL